MKLKAALFDLDGTLLDSLEDIADAANAILEKYSFPKHTLDEYRFLVGSGARDLIQHALPEDKRDNATIDRCLVEYRDIYSDNWNSKSRPYPGVVKMLDTLTEMNIPLAVFSNKAQKFTELCVKEWFSRWSFGVVMGASEKHPLKPHPQGALEIAEMLELEPEEFAYLGDTSIDMETANGAGMYAVGALWGFRPRSELERSGAKKLITRPEELADLFF